MSATTSRIFQVSRSILIPASLALAQPALVETLFAAWSMRSPGAGIGWMATQAIGVRRNLRVTAR